MIVAERTLTLNQSGKDVPVNVRIFLPFKDDHAWGCRWEIQWPDRLRASEIFGYDSAQALLHAFQSVGSELYASDAHISGNLRWTDKGSGYGFPVPGVIRDRLTGDDAEYF